MGLQNQTRYVPSSSSAGFNREILEYGGGAGLCNSSNAPRWIEARLKDPNWSIPPEKLKTNNSWKNI